MKGFAIVAVVAFSASCVAGCASIIKGSDQSVTFRSEPAGARIVVTDVRKGEDIHVGETPFTTSLKRGGGYFKAARYRIVVEKPGFKKQEVMLEGSLNGWYIGNVIFGGLGFLVIDPLTGAMWKLDPDDLNMTLQKDTAMLERGDMTLVVTTLDQVPPETLARLKRIEQ
jgi:hypothetical protein